MRLRGYDIGGAGPRSDIFHHLQSHDSDAIGGVTRFAGYTILSTPLPFKFENSDSFRAFAFANYGALLPLPTWPLNTALNTSTVDILNNLRVSVGTGFTFGLGPIRLEITYGIPLIGGQDDKQKKFQFGFGLSMNI